MVNQHGFDPADFLKMGQIKNLPQLGCPQMGQKISEDFRVKNDPENKLPQSSVGQSKKSEQNENL